MIWRCLIGMGIGVAAAPSAWLAVDPDPVAAPVPAPIPAPVESPAPVPMARLKPQAGSDVLDSIIEGSIDGTWKIGRPLLMIVPNVLRDLDQVLEASGQVSRAIADGSIVDSDVAAAVQKLFHAVQPTSAPKSPQDAVNQAASMFKGPQTSESLLGNVLGLVLSGFTSNDLIARIEGLLTMAKSEKKYDNPPVPADKEFYNRISGDAPFSATEESLRDALRIPESFTWGRKQPVLMAPGTGITGSLAFRANLGKLLEQTDYADPVYLDIPGNLLWDVQLNAEFVAYAMHYMAALTGSRPAIISWSQGSIDTQWALKYWPSLRTMVTDHIPISPDYHGTIFDPVLCSGLAALNALTCTPAVLQQAYNSRLIRTLRADGGDSAYVPTTTVYSGVDEIVQPQIGIGASGFIRDARGVGASNNFLQGACLLQPAGGLYLHAGVLFNPVAWALVVDALTHEGPGRFERVRHSCQDVAAPGLSLSDVIETVALIPLSVLLILSYSPKVTEEPAIRAYAAINN